jgi:hypothetical protein
MHPRSPSLRARLTLAGLARALALVWLVPALLWNIDWTGISGWAHNGAAVGTILGAALLIHISSARPHLIGTPVLLLVALFMVYGNTKQAVRALSFSGEVASEAREAKIAAGSQVASQRSHLEKRREAQVKVAGEAAAATLEAELEAIKVAEPRRWQLTRGCHPDEVTKSVTFCLQVAQAKAKVAAAAERDKIDAEMARLPAAATISTGLADGQKQVADPYVANVIELLRELGLRPSERLVKSEEAVSRALGLELLAAFGPSCWLIFVDLLAGVGGAASSASARFKGLSKRLRNAEGAAPPAPGEPAKADAIDRWIADDLEVHAGTVTFAKALRQTPGWPAHQPGITENAIWQRLKKVPGVKHDPNSGRPRYFGLRIRAKGPTLVVNNV